MQLLARRLISLELNASDESDTEGRAAIRVCGKLGESLSALAGRRGFHSLLARAVALAGADLPWLNNLSVGADGVLKFPEGLETRLGREEAAIGGMAVVGHLLELLAAFVGEELTVRLAQQVWPNTELTSESEGNV